MGTRKAIDRIAIDRITKAWRGVGPVNARLTTSVGGSGAPEG